jgi:ABC-type phosphate/phosphonate transport system substrate-binding protein
MRSTTRLLPGCLLCVLTALPGALAGDTSLRIGIPQTFFHDMSPELIRQVTDPFADVLRETTGLKGEPVTGGDPLAVARLLSEDRLQLAVLHGFEFAWAQQKYPNLEPLMIAVRADRDYRAHVVVRAEGAPASLAELKGKDLAVPKRATESCRLYLQQLCEREGTHGLEDFFGRIVRPTDVETGLDDLVRGKFAAAVVDSYNLAFYKDLKPGVFTRLKVLMQSDVLPPLVIAHHKGALPEATLARIRDGLRASAKTDAGRDIMKLWHVSAFGPVPDDFATTMAAALKTYPPRKAKD